jgi:hypothetical protein
MSAGEAFLYDVAELKADFEITVVVHSHLDCHIELSHVIHTDWQ